MSGNVKDIKRLPLSIAGFGLTNIPAIPIDLRETLATLVRLGLREEQTKQATQGFTNVYKIGDFENTGYTYLFGTGEKGTTSVRNQLMAKLENARGSEDAMIETLVSELREMDVASTAETAAEAITALPLESPDQFSMSWTTFPPIYREAQPLQPGFEAVLTDVDAASRAFWPTIAQSGLPYNLLLLAKVDASRLADLRNVFAGSFGTELEAAAAAGLLYMLDLRFFERLRANTVKGFPRFTPATLTVLVQDSTTKALEPVLIRVSGRRGDSATVYTRKSAAFLYALTAARSSVTLYGIWLGHVYHWHIPTAAMQMTLWNNVPAGHPLLQLLGPQSNYLIGFDDVLLLLWRSIAPPTSVSSAWQFLMLMNEFAAGRSFFDDDPPVEIAQLGLRQEDFSVNQPWDAYPLVGHLLDIWKATEEYVAAFIAETYPSDAAVQQDQALQSWIAAAGSSGRQGGNLQGLPQMNSRAALSRVLVSQIFRVTAHGTSRLARSANPVLTFISNFPPCLQQTNIPPADQSLTTAELLAFLPRTGTLGEMMNFYSIFSFSVPYVPFIPLAGIDEDLFFDAGSTATNAALVEYRRKILGFIEKLDDGTLQRFQWPLNVET